MGHLFYFKKCKHQIASEKIINRKILIFREINEEEMEKVYRIFTVLNNLSRRHTNCIQRRFLRIESYRNSQSSPFINSIIAKSNSFLPKATLFSLGGISGLNLLTVGL